MEESEIINHISNINNSHEYDTWLDYKDNVLSVAISNGSRNCLDFAIKKYPTEIINKYFIDATLVNTNKRIMIYSKKYKIRGIKNKFDFKVENKYFLKQGYIYYSFEDNKNFTYLNTIISRNTMLVLFENDAIAKPISLDDLKLLKYIDKNMEYENILEIQKDYDFSDMDTNDKRTFLSATYEYFTIPKLSPSECSEILEKSITPREFINKVY